MALVAMERPPSLSPDDIRDEKLKVLRCVPPLSTDHVVLGQYAVRAPPFEYARCLRHVAIWVERSHS